MGQSDSIIQLTLKSDIFYGYGYNVARDSCPGLKPSFWIFGIPYIYTRFLTTALWFHKNAF